MIYQLSYELKSVDFDYMPFYSFLETGMGQSSIHVLRDVWWIQIDSKPDVKNLCEQLRKFLSDKDVFYVAPLSNEDVNGWLPTSIWNWYRDIINK